MRPLPRRVLLGLFLTVASTTLVAQSVADRIYALNDEGQMSPREVDAFYAPLFAGTDAPTARYPVDVYTIQFGTRYPDGTELPFRVQVFVPERRDPVDGVYLFSPGSTGMIGPCRASREHVAGIRWGLYRAHVLAMAGQGFVGVLPDYMGFEDPTLVQPYFHAASEARVVFDALRGVDRWIRDAYPTRFPRGIRPYRRVASGFSQGGHAAFAAADRNGIAGGEVYLHGVIGYGPTTEVEPMLIMYPSLAPMVVMSYRTVYGDHRFDPAAVLKEPYASDLAYDTTRQCVGGMQRFYPSRAPDLLHPDFLDSLYDGTLADTHPTIHRVFQANRTGLAPHGVPALILQGTNDIVVSRKTQENFVAALRAVGNPVDYRLFEGARHDTRQIGFETAVAWIRGLDPDARPRQTGAPRRFDPELDR